MVAGALAIGFTAARSPVLAVGGAFAATMAYLVLARADMMLLVLIALLPWEGLIEVTTGLATIRIFGFLVVAAYVVRFLTRDVDPRWNGAMLAAVSLLAITLVSFATANAPADDALVKVNRYALLILVTIVIAQMLDSRAQILAAVRVWVVSVALAAVYGVFMMVTGQVDRASGPIPDPNDFGLVVGATIPLALFLLSQRSPSRWFYGLCAGALFVGLLATLSRGGLVGFGIAAAWAIASGHLRIRHAFAGLAAAVGIVLLSFTLAGPTVQASIDRRSESSASNISSRQSFWRAALFMSADYPFLGGGPDSFGYIAPREYIRGNDAGLDRPVVHNTYLELTAEGGALSLAAFLAMLALTWIGLGRVWTVSAARSDPELGRLVTALKASLVAVAVAGFFISAQVIVGYWLLVSLAGALTFVYRPEPEELSKRPEPHRTDGLALARTRPAE